MIPASSNDQRISPLLSGVTWLEVAVLVVAGGGLLIAQPVVVGIWPWSLAPFNLRFLGALYTAALVAAFLQSWIGRWAPARTVTTMIFVFTLVVTACSFLHWDRFDPGKVEVWVWFVLYIGVCVNAGAHLWWYRDALVAGSPPPSGPRAALLAQAVVLGGYGLALLVAPEHAGRLWPWKVDAFHAQLYSVTFLTPAAGALSPAEVSGSGRLVHAGHHTGCLGAAADRGADHRRCACASRGLAGVDGLGLARTVRTDGRDGCLDAGEGSDRTRAGQERCVTARHRPATPETAPMR